MRQAIPAPYGHHHTAETSSATPEGVIRFLFYGLCAECFKRRRDFTQEECKDIAIKVSRQEVQWERENNSRKVERKGLLQ
jgi:hypothetical protein